MKIVITVGSYSPRVNGVQAVTQYQAEGLARLGHQVTVITSCHDLTVPEVESINGVKVLRVDAYDKYARHYGDKDKFIKLVMEESASADALMCVCLESFAADWVLGIIDRISCLKVLMLHGIHEYSWNAIDKSSWKRFLKKAVLDVRWGMFYQLMWKYISHFDRVIHLSESDYSHLLFARKGYLNNYVLPNAVEDRCFVNKKDRKNDSLFRILHVSNYAENKNQLFAAQMYAQANLNNSELVFVGSRENAYFEKVEEYSKEYNAVHSDKTIRCLVGVDREETINLLHNSDICILSSYSEHMPMTILEAMAAGIPFVSTDVGLVKEFPGGIICKERTEMASYMKKLYDDKDMRIQLGNAGKEYAERYCRQLESVERLEWILRGICE